MRMTKKGAGLAAVALLAAWGVQAGQNEAARMQGPQQPDMILPLPQGGAPQDQRQVGPGDARLKEMERRLFPEPECKAAGACAQIQSAKFSGSGSRMEIELEIHALARSKVALPKVSGARLVEAKGGSGQFRRGEGADEAFALAEPGSEKLTLSYKAEKGQVSVAFPNAPKRTLAEESFGKEWSLSTQPGASSATLSKIGGKRADDAESGGAQRFDAPLYFEALRKISVEPSETKVVTTLKRKSPPEAPASARVALAAGERALGDSVKQEGGEVLVEWKPGQTEVSFESRIDSRSFELSAPKDWGRKEVWVVKANPRLLPKAEGMDPSATSTEDGSAVYEPFGGEKLKVSVSEPKAVGGSWMAWDKVEAVESGGAGGAGGSIRETSLKLLARASSAGVAKIGVPAEWRLVKALVEGTEVPLAGKEGNYALQLPQGRTEVEMWFNAPTEESFWEFRSAPKLRLEAPAANLTWSAQPSWASRWLLWSGGDALGPAVRIWGVLAALAAGLFWLWKLAPKSSWSFGLGGWMLLGLPLALQNAWFAVAVAAGPALLAWCEAKGGKSLGGRGLATAALAAGALALAAGLFNGLVGAPDPMLLNQAERIFMGRSSGLLWYQDFGSDLPDGWFVTMPLWVYKALMLGWALASTSYLAKKVPAMWLAWSSLAPAAPETSFAENEEAFAAEAEGQSVSEAPEADDEADGSDSKKGP